MTDEQRTALHDELLALEPVGEFDDPTYARERIDEIRRELGTDAHAVWNIYTSDRRRTQGTAAFVFAGTINAGTEREALDAAERIFPNYSGYKAVASPKSPITHNESGRCDHA